MRDENLDLWQYHLLSGNTVFMVTRLRGGAKSDPFCKLDLVWLFKSKIKIACYLLVLPLALYISLLPCL